MKEKIVEKMFDIELFSWEDWDEVLFDNDIYQFYNVDFFFRSMKEYNGKTVTLNRNGYLEIYDNDEEGTIIWKGFVYQIPEFMDELNKSVKDNG